MTAVSVRIPDEQARALKALAVAKDASVSTIARMAITEHIDMHRAERAAQKRLGSTSKRGWELFDEVTG
ncbi:MAG TPA: DUF6290 family protein [Solirubrobacteraceae bacterium]|jgi:predicted transcriptional regulator